MNNILEKCYCGSEAYLETTPIADTALYQYRCSGCGEKGLAGDTEWDAAKNWSLKIAKKPAREKKNTDNRDQSLKADAGKIMMELVPVTAEESIGRVMTDAVVNVGYGVDSWKGVDMQRYVGALRRHLIAFQREPLGRDEKSGLLHSEHLLCNAAFLNDMVRREVAECECR